MNIKDSAQKNNFKISWGGILSSSHTALMILILKEIDIELSTRGYKQHDGHFAKFTFFNQKLNPHIREDSYRSKNISLSHLVEIERIVNTKIPEYIQNLDSLE